MKFSKFYHILLILINQQSALFAECVVGTFEQLSESPYQAGAGPAWVAYSPVVSGNLFAGVPNYSDGTVSVYQVDTSNGTLLSVPGSPFSSGSGAGSGPAWLAYSPEVSGNVFAAVPNANDSTLSVFMVDTLTGAFSTVTGQPFSTGVTPYSVAFTLLTSGVLCAAVANNGDGTIWVYTVDPNTGVFTTVAGNPFSAGSGPYTIVFSPVVSGNMFAAVTNQNDNTVSVYSVDQTSGVFTQVAAPFSTGISPIGLSFSPEFSGKLYAAVTNSGDNTVSIYLVDQDTGYFSEIPQSPVDAGSSPNTVAYSPFVYGTLLAAVSNFYGDTVKVYIPVSPKSATGSVNVYQVDPNSGTFVEIPGSPFATGVNSDGVAFSPILKGSLYALVPNFGDGTVNDFQVNIGCDASPIVRAIFTKYCSSNS